MEPPIVQFWHPNRPHVNYEEMPSIEMCNVNEFKEEYPYLEAIKAMWRGWAYPDGLIVLEQDIAIDPQHIYSLRKLAYYYPTDVCAAPYAVWPASTGRKVPCWAHALNDKDGRRHHEAITTCPEASADWFGLGFTYLPAKLIDEAPGNDKNWTWQIMSDRFSELARELGIHCYVMARPVVHLHW